MNMSFILKTYKKWLSRQSAVMFTQLLIEITGTINEVPLQRGWYTFLSKIFHSKVTTKAQGHGGGNRSFRSSFLSFFPYIAAVHPK